MSTDKSNPVRSSTKRPRAPIACFRCHHKKVRCDGARPNCTRCLSTGVLCAYPSARKSRTTQPTNIDPFIDNLSQLEARIRQIEIDLESQKSMIQSLLTTQDQDTAHSHMVKTESEVQDSKMILAQLRLRGEQRILKGKRAAAAADKQAKSKSPINDKMNTDMENYSLSMSMYSQNMMMNDWTLLNMFDDLSPTSTRSSSLASNVTLQPSHSTTSVTSNNTALSSTCSSTDPIFSNFSMEDIMLQHPIEIGQDVNMLYTTNVNNSVAPVWYNF